MEEPAEPQQTSTGVYILYGAGMLGSAAIGFVSSSWLLYYYLPPGATGRVPAAFFGVATLTSYLVSAALIPLIGYLSDALRSPWGRRLPFMSLDAPANTAIALESGLSDGDAGVVQGCLRFLPDSLSGASTRIGSQRSRPCAPVCLAILS